MKKIEMQQKSCQIIILRRTRNVLVLSFLIRGNINWALKKIKHGKLKVLFGRLNTLFGRLIKLFGP